MDVGVPKCCSGNPAPVNAALVDLQPGGQTTSSELRGAAGYKRPRIVEFGTSYKGPMSSSGGEDEYKCCPSTRAERGSGAEKRTNAERSCVLCLVQLRAAKILCNPIG
ncbi:jg18210 [Pararge aegeria aegeria]|uniref:Jg18210 protein n=1 Tax=Pararge aegeria aegeria TaxID=348720 RepID=A0A8S4QS79_9NEOP|nr:jg18210 [Pararge aegeria aegeria]